MLDKIEQAVLTEVSDQLAKKMDELKKNIDNWTLEYAKCANLVAIFDKLVDHEEPAQEPVESVIDHVAEKALEEQASQEPAECCANAECCNNG